LSVVSKFTFFTALAWHPVHPLLVSGGSEGDLIYWDLYSSLASSNVSEPRAVLSQAHDSNIWALAFHPIGHLLVTGSNDHTTRFWARERPGDATSVFSGGGEKPPEQDPEAEDDFEGALPGLGDYPGDQDDNRMDFDSFHTAALSGGGESPQGYGQLGRPLSSQGVTYPGQNEEHGFSQGKTRWGP